MLGNFDPEAKTIMNCDELNLAIGCVLIQVRRGAKWPKVYASRTLCAAEMAYSVHAKKHLVVYMHVNTFIIFCITENLK